MQMYGHVTIPSNFTPISKVETYFTAIRKLREYPILASRFTT